MGVENKSDLRQWSGVGDQEKGGKKKREAESKLAVTEIDIPAKEGLDKSEMYHVVKEIIGFILHMHQQIPSILQRLEDEFDDLRKERECLEETNLQPINPKSSTQRMHKYRIREVKQRLKRLDKLMASISSFLSSFSLVLDETPDAQEFILIIGASLARPLHAYEISFSTRRRNSECCEQNIRRKVKEVLSRKVIRTLMSMGAGGVSYTGPVKLFLLVKAPSTLNLPLHFLPKRDFRYSKKVTPLKLHIKCKAPVGIADDSGHAHLTCDFSSSDLIWYQCRHTIKGLSRSSSLPE